MKPNIYKCEVQCSMNADSEIQCLTIGFVDKLTEVLNNISNQFCNTENQQSADQTISVYDSEYLDDLRNMICTTCCIPSNYLGWNLTVK